VKVAVVGAGVVGLNCAVALRDAGHEVEVIAADRPADTTSAVAAALWYPYRALPEREVTRWAAATYDALVGLAANPATGVRVLEGRELLRTETPEPWWRDAVPALEKAPKDELPPGYAQAWQLPLPVVDMPVHLGWLLQQATSKGVRTTWRRVDRLDDLDAEIVVHCSGLGARELAADPDMVPIRGQVVLVEQIGLDRWVLDATDPAAPTYVVPRHDTIVLGGTAEDGDEDLTPRPSTAQDVLARCTALVPELAGARVVAQRVGLRPGRTTVRVEREGRVVHCYGHGGAGVTLAHGCAGDVVGLVG
jgi:D-amino-acid oxidase